MCDTYDYRLFNNITRNPHHILHQLLPSVAAAAENYNLRARKHNRFSHNVLRVSMIRILSIELFILTFINFLQNYILTLLCCGLSTFYLINE